MAWLVVAALSLDRSFVTRAIDKVKPSLCIVTPVGVRNTTARGTGFVVAPGRIMTASHVALPGWRLEVCFDDEKYPATVVDRDDARDLALLQVDCDKPALDVRVDEAVLGEFAVCLGYPAAVERGSGPRLATTLGVVASVSDQAVIADSAVSPGMSGGPVVDADGDVLGVASQMVLPLGVLAAPARACLTLLNEPAAQLDASAVTAFDVVLFNDPFNTRKRVQKALVDAGLDAEAADKAMQQAHTQGRSLVKSFAPDLRDAADKLCVDLRSADLLVDVEAKTS